jgi:hypothetical protein
MRRHGITYDTGFRSGGSSTHEPFDPDVVRREMRIIREDLHCTAVRVTGGHVDRLETAAVHAAAAGLEVWLSPFTTDLTAEELLDLLAEVAVVAERLRLGGAEVVVVTGSEVSLFNVGFLPGDALDDRLALLTGPPAALGRAVAVVPHRINDFLAKAVAVVRERFGGRVTYASLPFEQVDWEPFDIVSTDAGYRSAEVADTFADQIRAYADQEKPTAITEFGCTTHRGAADLGARGAFMVEWDGPRPVALKGEFVRDEQEQATYLRELLDVHTAAGIDTAFVCTFASYNLPHSADPRRDFDVASYGVVKVLEEGFGTAYPDLRWEPKAAFAALADYFGR